MFQILSTCPCINGHLDGVPLLDIVNNVISNMSVLISFGILFLILWIMYPKLALLDHIRVFIFNFLRSCHTVSNHGYNIL